MHICVIQYISHEEVKAEAKGVILCLNCSWIAKLQASYLKVMVWLAKNKL